MLAIVVISYVPEWLRNLVAIIAPVAVELIVQGTASSPRARAVVTAKTDGIQPLLAPCIAIRPSLVQTQTLVQRARTTERVVVGRPVIT